MTNKSNDDLNINNDIDISNFFNRINNIINKIGYSIYRLFNFFIKKIKIFILIIILGFSTGYYFDYKMEQISINEILVIPNFNSIDYLYNNKNYTKNIFGKHLNDISIEPINNFLEFLDNNKNLKVFEAINKNGSLDLEKFFNKESITKNYKYHLITIKTEGLTKKQNQNYIDKYLQKLNSDKYFNSIRKVDYLNNKNKRNELLKSVEKINVFFDNIGYQNTTSNFSLNSFNQVDDLINSKQNFLDEINLIDIELIEQSKVIYEVYRIENKENKNLYLKFILPILFVFLLFFIFILRKMYYKFKKMN